MAYDGSSPAARAATAVIDVVVVLPCVPATATTRLPCMSPARATERWTTGHAGLAGGARPRGCRPDRGGHDDEGGPGDVGGVVADVDARARAPPARARVSEARESEPVTGDAVVEQQPDDGAHARPRRRRRRGPGRCAAAGAAPRPTGSAVGPAAGVAGVIRGSPGGGPDDEVGQAVGGVEDAVGAGGARPWRASRAGSREQRQQRARSPRPGSRSASSTSSPPPAATSGSALRRCSPLPTGSGT